MSYFEYEGKKVYYETYGQGKPIVILNGIMMSTASWKAFIEAFSANNQLILVDFLDQGKSDKMEDTPYTQAIQVEVVRTLLDELKLEKTNVVGISYGGEVALQFAVKYKDCVDSLVLFNTTGKTSNWLRDIGVGWNRSVDDSLNYYCTTIPYIYSPSFYGEKSDWMDRRKELLTKGAFNDKAFMGSMTRLTESADYYDVLDKLPNLKIPTLIVSSESDFVTPIHEQRKLHELIKNSEHIIIPNAGHASMYEKPVLFATLVLGFINMEQKEFNIL